MLGVLGAAIGVWLVGSMAPHAAPFTPTLLGATAGTFLGFDLACVGAILGLRWKITYRDLHARAHAPPPPERRGGVVGRAARLLFCTALFWASAGVGVYQHATIQIEAPPRDGASKTTTTTTTATKAKSITTKGITKSIYVRDALRHVARSPLWSEGAHSGSSWVSSRVRTWVRTWESLDRAYRYIMAAEGGQRAEGQGPGAQLDGGGWSGWSGSIGSTGCGWRWGELSHKMARELDVTGEAYARRVLGVGYEEGGEEGGEEGREEGGEDADADWAVIEEAYMHHAKAFTLEHHSHEPDSNHNPDDEHAGDGGTHRDGDGGTNRAAPELMVHEHGHGHGHGHVDEARFREVQEAYALLKDLYKGR